MKVKSEREVAQSCLTLCDHMDCRSHQTPLSLGFPRQEYRSGLPFLSLGDPPDLGIAPTISELAGGFLAIEPPGKPKIVAAAAAKSLQSCPTLCDPIDGTPPGSPVPGILQARTLEWVAISFSNLYLCYSSLNLKLF